MDVYDLFKYFSKIYLKWERYYLQVTNSLKKNKDIVVLAADKKYFIVTLYKCDYIKKVNRIIEDESKQRK